jgi:hypothetical protein
MNYLILLGLFTTWFLSTPLQAWNNKPISADYKHNIKQEITFDQISEQILVTGVVGGEFLTGKKIQGSKSTDLSIVLDVFNSFNPADNIGLEALNNFIEDVDFSKMNLTEKLRAVFLSYSRNTQSSRTENLIDRINYLIKKRSYRINHSSTYTILNNENIFKEIFGPYTFKRIMFKNIAYDIFRRVFDTLKPNGTFRTKTKKEITDLAQFKIRPDSTNSSRYLKAPKLLMFCRKSRLFPCRFLMKDQNNQFVRDSTSGKIWNQPALGSSKYGKKSNVRNGNTPSGVYTINSVMPKPNKQKAYGKFRRTILNFIPKKKNEATLKSFLPLSAHDKDWWKEGVVARDVGRQYLRIHGTGKRNDNRVTPYYTHVRTSGCISQREKKYDDTTFKDQRGILDHLMKAQGLEPKYKNEPSIHALLYVIEIDSSPRSVQMSDLKRLIDGL